MGDPSETPKGWRDTYDLVKDTRDELLAEIVPLRESFNTHLIQHAEARGRASMWGSLRTFISTALPIPATILALIALLTAAAAR